MRILTLLLLTLLLPSMAQAGIFNPPPTDKSVELLGSIFGTHIGSVYLGGAANPTLMRMFEMFNVVVIAIGTIIVSYIGVVSTINTAQEGKTMGKKWSSIWIPMRAVLGMCLIIPTPYSGYSVVQTTVMWMILQGIGAADSIWNGILGDLGSGLAVNKAIQRPEGQHPVYKALDKNGLALTQNLLHSAVCMFSLHDIANKYQHGTSEQRDSEIARYGSHVNIYHHKTRDNPVNANQASVSGTIYIGVNGSEHFNDICGKYTIVSTVNRAEFENHDQISQAMLLNKANELYETKFNAVRTMFSNLSVVAAPIVAQSTVTPRDTNGRLRPPRGDEIITPAGHKSINVSAYAKILSSMAKPQRDVSVQEIVRKGMLNGWISAGSFYFVLNHSTNTKFFSDVELPIVADLVPSCNDKTRCADHFVDNPLDLNEKIRSFVPLAEHEFIAHRLWDTQVYLKFDNTSIDQSIVDELNRQPNARESDLQREVTRLFSKLMSEKSADPIIAQGQFGAQLMEESEELWKDPLHKQQALINRAAQESGLISDALRELINAETIKGTMALNVYGVVWIIGATLAIYVPLIPYMMFTVAVLGWFLIVIEAIVAAPILAISFILPSGEELGKIMQGLMLLLNIVLRPTLMLFGFILASRLYRAIIELVNFSMLGNFSAVTMDRSLFASVAIVCLYAAFVLALANK